MNKIKEYAPTLLLLLLIIVIVVILVVKNKKNESPKFTEGLQEISIKEAIEIYDDVNPHLIIIERENCSACQEFMPVVQELVEEYELKVYYIDLLKIDKSSEEYTEFTKLLNYTTEVDGEEGTLDKFIMYTPMILISSNNETIYGMVGSMSKGALESVLENYSIIK